MDEKYSTVEESVIWGKRAVAEALAAGRPVNRVYFARQARGAEIEKIKGLARQRQVRFDFVEVGKLGGLAGTREHQDVVACMSPVEYAGLEDLLRRAEEGKTSTVVALDQVQHPGNLGMVIRTAAGAGAGGVLLPTRGGRMISGEVVRASAGAVFRVPIVASGNLGQDLERLKEHGFWVYGLEAAGETDLFDVEWPARRVLVAGNESKGLRPSIRKLADALVRIPLAGNLDSLNVAVATGVALFDIARQEGRSTGSLSRKGGSGLV